MSADSGLLEVLDRLIDLVEPVQLSAVVELRRRAQLQQFRVLVVGEAKRGKSTLINALLRRELLPTGVVPVTAVTTTVAFGTPERVVVEYRDGRVSQDEPVDGLAHFVTEAENPSNGLGVERVTVLLDALLLRGGVELVDTPGAGSVYAHDLEAEQALATMDAAVFVLTVDPPLSAGERDLLIRVTEASVRTFVVLNKVDRLDSAELSEVTSFVAAATAEVLGVPPQLFPCSARRALQARIAGLEDHGSGVPWFEAAFLEYLRTGRARALQHSLSRRARQATDQSLDGVRMRLRLTSMQTVDAAARVVEFRRRLDRIGQRALDAADLVAAGVRHLLEELNESAAQAEHDLTVEVITRIKRRLEVDLAQLTPGDLRQRGRSAVVDRVREAVEGWRARQQVLLEQGLRDLEDRLLEELAGELEGLRAAATDLLDVELTVEGDRSRLVEDDRFFYLLTEGVGWNDLVTDTIRRHLRGSAARRRAEAHLVAEAGRLTRQQVGRVRADFQYRLQEGGRALARALTDRYGASTAAIRTALEDAASVHGQSAAASDRLRAVLTDRESALLRVRQELVALEAPPP